MHVDVWETILKKNDSKFVKDLAVHVWGTSTLQNKCLHAARANKNIRDEESIRNTLTPTKYKLIKGTFPKMKSCILTKETAHYFL